MKINQKNSKIGEKNQYKFINNLFMLHILTGNYKGENVFSRNFTFSSLFEVLIKFLN